jgi:glycosyltransferase involved in cell wall biosynthesis
VSLPDAPRVSVVMATLNAERYLATALESINAQTFADIETIVVDGGSSDGSAEIAAGLGARVLRQRGSGLFEAWNEGLGEIRGELFALLDSDDRWEPDKIELQVAALDEDPELDYVIGYARHFLEPGMPPPPGFRPEIVERELPAPMPGALLARRRVLDVVGPFRTRYEIASDIDWFARLKDSGLRSRIVPGALIHKRMHDSNLSHFQAESMNAEIVALLRRSIARQRSS